MMGPPSAFSGSPAHPLAAFILCEWLPYIHCLPTMHPATILPTLEHEPLARMKAVRGLDAAAALPEGQAQGPPSYGPLALALTS
jgi:hypothetical protein